MYKPENILNRFMLTLRSCIELYMQVMQSPLRIAIALCMSESLYLYKGFYVHGRIKGKVCRYIGHIS